MAPGVTTKQVRAQFHNPKLLHMRLTERDCSGRARSGQWLVRRSKRYTSFGFWREAMLKVFAACSLVPHHITTTARCGLEQSHPSHVHSRTEINAGEDHQVCWSIQAKATALTGLQSFMAHPETLLPMPEIDDPVQRFLSVVKFYLSGWHIKPP